MNKKEDQEYRIGWLTTEELAELFPEVKTVIIPVGSTEQHGRNSTLNTDTVLAEEVARLISVKLQGEAIVLPSLQVGISYHHMSWVGSMTISPRTMQAVLEDYIKSFKDQGITHYVLLNGHGGNQDTLASIAHYLRYEYNVNMLNVFYWKAADEEIKEKSQTNRFGHACEIETSFLQYLMPGCVREESLEPGRLKSYPVKDTELEKKGRIDYPYHWKELTENGVFGDARYANKETGKFLIDLIVTRLHKTIRDFSHYKPL